MMKFTEQYAEGGESRLLHLDDWEERDLYSTHRLARKSIRYKAPGSKQVENDVVRPTFFDSDHGLAISFIDQFAQPDSLLRGALSARYEFVDGKVAAHL